MVVVASPYIAESIGKETVFVRIMMKNDLTDLASALNIQCMKE